MKRHSLHHLNRLSILCAAVSFCAVAALAAPGDALYGDPPNDTHPWAVHDMNRPRPPVITPGTASTPERPGKAPSDAIVLFDGTDLSKWAADRNGAPAKWKISDGAMEPVRNSGDIQTRQDFGDCQLHVEWATPVKVQGDGQGRGNSGVFLMDRYEVQVMDSYQNDTYADGQAASIYGQNPPYVNACRGPGEWQSYDIIFRRPIFKDGQLAQPGTVTVLHNGVLVQDNWVIEGPTSHMGRTKPEPHGDKGPVKFQDHGNPVRYRNVWIRELAPRNPDGTVGPDASREAVAAKRKEIAKGIRKDAQKQMDAGEKLPALNTLMESLQYDKDETAVKSIESLFGGYLDELKKLEKAAVQDRKGEILSVLGGFKFLARHRILENSFEPKVKLEAFVAEKGLEEKR